MLLFSLAIVTGLIVLIWSADQFVSASVVTALKLGMTPMMIGLTVVAFGTSAPELIVSATAAFDNSSHLAIGNAIGSNIANIALVLGATAMVSAIPLKKSILKVELPILLGATSLATLVIIDGKLTTSDGVILLLILLISLFFLAKFQTKDGIETPELELEIPSLDKEKQLSSQKAIFYLISSLFLLIASSKALVWGAVGIATYLGVSELVIGLTIVAIGTSLPELAASVTSALKGHHDLALGNVIGSNLFNLLAVMAIPTFIGQGRHLGIAISEDVLSRDYALMLALTFGLAIISYLNYMFKKESIGKFVGISFLTIYLIYLFILYQQSVVPNNG